MLPPAEAEYDSAYTFLFSSRPGTEAAEMTDRLVPADVAAERFERLRVVVERSALAKHRARIGRVEEVLVEGPSKRDPAVLSGRTRQNKLVHFAAGGTAVASGTAVARGTAVAGGGLAAAPGTFVTVRITDAAPHHLAGELVGVTDRPRKRDRTRIPVAAG